MKDNKLFPNNNIFSPGVSNTRDFYKGRSFNFSGEWREGAHYFNDEFLTDFVAYNGVLLACRWSHLANETTIPVLTYDSKGVPNGVTSKYWDFVFAGTPGASGKKGQVYIPRYNSKTGDVTWEISDEVPELETINIKGEQGVQGKGIVDIKKTSSKGVVDTYTIKYSDNTEDQFSVTNGEDGVDGKDGKNGTNGRGIKDIVVESKSEKSTTYKMIFTDDTYYTFTVKNGLPGAKGETGERGRDGNDGKDGKDGKSATIRVSSVETVGPSCVAEVINVGTPTEAALKFFIPKGKQGDKGEKGDKGPQGPAGPEGKKVKLWRQYGDEFVDDCIKWGWDGEEKTEWTILCWMSELKGTSVIDVDITDDAHLAFKMSSGQWTYHEDEDGNPIKDENGVIIFDKWVPDVIVTEGTVTATIEVKEEVNTLAPDESARVENIGTPKNAVLEFFLPRGFTGEHAIHVGPEDPITYRDSHLDSEEIQHAYKNAEEMIWVDTENFADFDHLNAVYHAYLEACKLKNVDIVSLNEFAEFLANLSGSGIAGAGFKIKFATSVDALPTPSAEHFESELWLVPSTNPELSNVYEEWIVVKGPADSSYKWEKWGSGSINGEFAGDKELKELEESLRAEVVRATEKENELSSRLDEVEGKLDNLESKIGDNINEILEEIRASIISETNRAEDMENALRNSICYESNRAKNAEEYILSKIKNLEVVQASGIKTITSPDNSIIIEGDDENKTIRIDVSGLVDNDSSIGVDEDGKLDLFWN